MGHYFQKWGTIFFSPGIRFGAAISEGAQFHPVWDYIILYVKRGGVAVGPLGPPIVSGPVAKRVAVSTGGASLRSVKKILSGVVEKASARCLLPRRLRLGQETPWVSVPWRSLRGAGGDPRASYT